MSAVDQVRIGCAGRTPAPVIFAEAPARPTTLDVLVDDRAVVVTPRLEPPAAYLPPPDIVYLKGDKGDAGATGLTGIYQQAMIVQEQNVLPALNKPWRAGPGAFANIIIGAAFLTDQDGSVSFEDGSTTVLFHPGIGAATFNPGDVVVAQYSIA